MSLKYPLLEKVHINITRNPKLKVWLVVWNWSGQKSSSEIILSSLPLIISKWQKPIFCHNLSPPPYIPVQFTESSSSHYHTPHLSPHPDSPLHYLGRGFLIETHFKFEGAHGSTGCCSASFCFLHSQRGSLSFMFDLWNCFQIDMLIATPIFRTKLFVRNLAIL